MRDLYEILRALKANADERNALESEIAKSLAGCTLTIADPNYNGQPYGSSRKKQAGKSWVFDAMDWLAVDDESGMIWLMPPNARASISLSDCLIDGKHTAALAGDAGKSTQNATAIPEKSV